MAPTRKIVNMMKEMENSIETYIQKTIEEALKNREIRFNNKIDKIFLRLRDQERKLVDVINSQKFLNNEFEHLKNNVTNLIKLDLQKKKEFLMKKNQCLKEQIIKEEKMINDLHQYNKKENLEFQGMPKDPNKRQTILLKLGQKN